MKKKILIIMFFVVSVLGTPLPTKAETSINHRFFREFARALHDRDVSKLNSMTEPSVKIPEIREDTPIGGLETLPSPHKNTLVMIGSFQDDCFDNRPGGCARRIAFIWEVSIKNNKISKIKVVSDVANPHMNELIITKEYKEKFNKEILVPFYFPFKMTHVTGKISGEKINLYYKNVKLKSVLQIEAEPTATADELILPKRNRYKPVALIKNYKGVIGKIPAGYELIFLSDKMKYNVKLTGDNKNYKPNSDELIKVANSLLFVKEPRGMYSEENSDRKYQDADSFYRSLDKKEYVEFKNAKLNIREKTSFENVNQVLSRTEQYGEVRISRDGAHPKRQVYVFVSVSQDGKRKMVVFDAESGDKISDSRNWEE
ncbi:hypothetical protein NDK43_19640 [Neobacillus pocheonensis]|uniref:Uncharacterized protein n=1 Tax=Neobacillus pocheonensis TaxID=363869 RepID=A0ABT0WCW2_9BACI|nr:hypothetical protein [Neobacillus pocheonensis]